VHYLSTRNSEINESFLNILFQGLSKEGGLFLPSEWPSVSVKNLYDKSYNEVALEIIYPFIKDNISKNDLQLIINKTYQNFDNKNIAPLVEIEKNKFILELFYGPTFAFKDYALQLLGNLFSHLLEKSNRKITILGATSGDTGSAAIEAFKGKNNIEVFILHPHKKISEVQRRQMTTVLDKNVNNIALKGTFDNCQKIVKDLFVDSINQSQNSLVAVNSINFARLIFQTVYYFWAYIQSKQQKVSFVVPSGNFGNIFSARIAKFMGLPIEKLHIVTNSNDILHRTIKDGKMKINEVQQTYSPSMDIQISSNFERQLFESSKRNSQKIIEIMNSFFKKNEENLSDDILNDLQSIYTSHAVSNSETLKTINHYKKEYDYLSDPHTATGLFVLNKISNENPTISLACAHPAKFSDAIFKATNEKPFIPERLKKIFDQKEKMTILDNDFEKVKLHIKNKL